MVLYYLVFLSDIATLVPFDPRRIRENSINFSTI